MTRNGVLVIGAAIILVVAIVVLAYENQVPTWGIVVATAALVLATLVLGYHTSKLTLVTERLVAFEKRRRIMADMDMYQDIHEGNRWGWKPGDASERDGASFVGWDAWRGRCISYRPRIVHPDMERIYGTFVEMLRRARSLDEWGVISQQVQGEAWHRISELRVRLGKIESSIDS